MDGYGIDNVGESVGFLLLVLSSSTHCYYHYHECRVVFCQDLPLAYMLNSGI